MNEDLSRRRELSNKTVSHSEEVETHIPDEKHSAEASKTLSGGDMERWTPPDEDLVQKVVNLVEYYLSDENLAKDAFLLKHVRRNRMGFVNIKLLTSLKKMKQLTKDWRVTAYALRKSLKVELNEEGNKVRRKAPLPPSFLVQVPSKLLLVWNISKTHQVGDPAAPHRSSMESAIAILGPFGTISTIRVIRPGRELPPEVRKYGYKYPELNSQECVLVEYEDVEVADRAYRELCRDSKVINVVLVGRCSKRVAGWVSGCVEHIPSGKNMNVLRQQMERLQVREDDSS
ncbi:hypothetical protein Z043_102707 [Scleropages formosus]|uniref:HTH La-type RNA-binding domain-containing protein n=1 Tax=Scleropages formosus TaxID=113540 RepID=A0A0P7XM01_SCLFO|nr:hypothetical protein Z043_102707 [Scleropages formosus]